MVQAKGDRLCRMPRSPPFSQCMSSMSGQLNSLPGPPRLPVWAWCFVCFCVSVCFRFLSPRAVLLWLWVWSALGTQEKTHTRHQLNRLG